ncbi:MAG TPA: DUF2059 domain-containing protein [Planctomycetota bacterium]|jgi:hypothetical protein|nr:DUF2059 domain-containing protein [Planctomycetota bacterium]
MNTRLRAGVLVGIGIALVLPLARLQGAQEPSPKEQKVRKLLDLTGAASMGKQVMDAMLDQFGKMPNLPEGFIERFKEVASGQDLMEKVIPIYMKQLDEETLDGLIAFYQTEVGKKFLKAQPAILKESMEAGQKWGQELAQKALQRLQDSKKKDQ